MREMEAAFMEYAPIRLPFYSEELGRDNLCPSGEVRAGLLALLRSNFLNDEIMHGNVTLAMIRPSIGPTENVYEWQDRQAAEKIEEMIARLGVMAKFSFRFTQEAAEEFYQGVKGYLESRPPTRPGPYGSHWEEFIALMTSGPTTALLLYNADGNAISLWRAQLGSRNVNESRDNNTIRGRLSTDIYNNLVHGSDSPNAVAAELQIITELIDAGTEQSTAQPATSNL
jgi:nucleoside diphosphate kinase